MHSVRLAGRSGPVGFKGEIVADEALRDGQFVGGANRDGWHLRGVEAGRDYDPRFADLRESHDGDACPNCGGRLRFETAIEVGHIFKLGTRYSAALGAVFLDADGKQRPIVMGSYGIGPGRVMATAVEQQGEEAGIAWPETLAPFGVHVLSLAGGNAEVETVAANLAEELSQDHTVLLDERDARHGEKFADADLIGSPVRITVGRKTLEDGAVDVRNRSDSTAGTEERVPLSSVTMHLKGS